jgi:DNA-binding NarL/FixJ family response regulator/predicted regulator of Ras-like GTPase activity (Roadblock/LC7/MglB family)
LAYCNLGNRKGQAQRAWHALTFREPKDTIHFGLSATPSELREAVVTHHILIVDDDEAFATILKEGIQMAGEFQATIVTTPSEARDLAGREHLAMAIVDMDLQEENPLELLRTLRALQPELRLMIIPLDAPPEEVLQLGIQGTLPKPFFLPDIPAQIEAALLRPIGVSHLEPASEKTVIATPPAVRQPESSAPAIARAPALGPERATAATRLRAHLETQAHRLTDHLRYLARELNADAVLLTYGSELVAYAGRFGLGEAEQLARVVIDSWQASARVAAALGREKVCFEQSLHEGQDYLLYSLSAADEIVLSVALRADRPLGMIRYNTKQTAQELRPLLIPR